jgi:hypothetical protein
VFAVGPPNQFPHPYVNGLAQNYWVDIEVTPASGSGGASGPGGGDGTAAANPGASLCFF